MRVRRIAVRLALALATLVALVPAPPAAAARQHAIAAFFIGYVPDSLTINKGDSLVFINTDPFAGVGHTVTHSPASGTAPKFDSDVTVFGQSTEVRGISELEQGDYLITCRVHPIMRGFLFVGAEARSPTDTIFDLVF